MIEQNVIEDDWVSGPSVNCGRVFGLGREFCKTIVVVLWVHIHWYIQWIEWALPLPKNFCIRSTYCRKPRNSSLWDVKQTLIQIRENSSILCLCYRRRDRHSGRGREGPQGVSVSRSLLLGKLGVYCRPGITNSIENYFNSLQAKMVRLQKWYTFITVLLVIVWLDNHWMGNPNFVRSLSKLCPIVETLSSLCAMPIQWLSKYSVCPGNVQTLSNVCHNSVHCLRLGQRLDIQIQSLSTLGPAKYCANIRYWT